MKYMNLKKRMFALDLQLFAGDDGGSDGDDAGDDGDDQDDDSSDDGDDGDDGKKYTEKDMEEAIKKRLARERRKWQRKQESTPKGGKDDGKADDDNSAESEEAKARKEAETKASRLEVKIACFEADVAKESVDDVAALAHAYMAADEELDLEDAIAKVVKKYPNFKNGSADPYDDEDDSKGKAWGQRQKGKKVKTSGVEEAFLKKNPGLKI